MADRTVSVKLIADAQAYISGVEAAARKTREATQDIEKRLANQRQAMEQVGKAALIAGGVVATGMGLSVKAAMDWETAWAGVLKTVDGTPSQLGRVEEGLRGLTSVLPASHAEIAAVAEAAGQLGIQTDNVVAFTETMINLGETTNMTAEEAAVTLARFVNVMGTSQEEVANLGASLVELGNNYATTEGEILEMSQRLSGAGKQIGMSEGDVLGLATALSSVGIEAEAGGSAMSKVMIDIASSVDKGGERLQMFADVAGVSAEQFAEQWRTSPGEALALFVQGLADAESQGRSTFGILEQLGISEVRMRDALLRSASAADQFSEAMATGNRAFEENTALVDEAQKRYDTLESKIGIMRNQIVDAAIVLGEQLTPAVELMVEAFANFAEGLAGMEGPAAWLISWGGVVAGGILLLGGAALTVIPQIAAFRVALETLGVTGPKVVGALRGVTTMLGGPWGITLIAAIAVLAQFDRAMLDVSGNAEKLKNTLTAAGGAATWESFASGVGEDFGIAAEDVAALYESVNLLGSSGKTLGVLKDHAEQLGLALEGMSAEDAAAALGEIAEAGDLSDDVLFNLVMTSEALTERMYELANANGVNLDSMERVEKQSWVAAAMTGELDLQYGNLAESMDDTNLAADAVQAAVDDVTGSVQNQTTSIEESIDAIRELNNEYISVDDAAVSFYQAIDEINTALGEGMPQAANDAGDALDLTGEAGWEVQGMLGELAGSTKDSAAEILNLTGNTEDASARMLEGRDAFIEAAIGAGLTEEAAKALADQYGLLPDAVHALITAETTAAQEDVNWFIQYNNGRRIGIVVDMETGSRPDWAHNPGGSDKGLYAAGGRIPGYAPGYDDRIGYLRDGSVVGLGGGEYIMPTRMTDKYLHILEQMRQGTFPGYADGGRLATQTYNSSSSVIAPVTNVYTTVNAEAPLDENAVASLAARKNAAAFADALRR